MRKLLALIIMGLFAFGAFAGCIGGEEANEEPAGANEPVQTQDENSVEGNTQPVAIIAVLGTYEVGAELTFNGNGSSDEDGTIETYEWDFESDGTYDAEGENTAYIYDAAGNYTVTLTVTDDAGATNSATKELVIAEPGAGEVGGGENEEESTEPEFYTVTLEGSIPVSVTGFEPMVEGDNMVSFDLTTPTKIEAIMTYSGVGVDENIPEWGGAMLQICLTPPEQYDAYDVYWYGEGDGGGEETITLEESDIAKAPSGSEGEWDIAIETGAWGFDIPSATIEYTMVINVWGCPIENAQVGTAPLPSP